jgi:hypothetical protein
MPSITADQVLALAPDPASAQAGKKLAAARHWKSLGRDDTGLWGECQGSALYQVRVDLATLSVACSCPSRKFPCKHGVGLLLLAASDAVPTNQQPDWMSSWLAKRAAKAAPKPAPAETDLSPEERAKAAASAAKAAAKRIEQRQKLMSAGMDGLDLWLSDLMRNGIAGLEAKGANFWETQAARLVDAQAPGPAGRLRRMAEIPGSGPDWPERLLAELGKLALLSQAWRRLDALETPLQETVRQQMGWNLSAEEVDARGELVSDRWLVLGQWVDNSDRLRAQRTWLQGERSERLAVIMQFAPAHMPFTEVYLPGSTLTTDLRFWPGAYPLRAKVAGVAVVDSPTDESTARGEAATKPAVVGYETIEAFLSAYAAGLAREPWLDHLGCVLRDVIPMRTKDHGWLARDAAGAALPLAPGDHWYLFAISSGHPVDLMADWDGEALLPLGVTADVYTPLTGARP